MKKVILATFTVAIIGIRCNKNNHAPVQNETNGLSNNYFAMKQVQDPKNKKANLDGGPNDPGCITGEGYCVEVIVTPKFTEAFKSAISKGTISEFLTNSLILQIGQGDGKIISDLHLVKNGVKQITYVDFPNSKGIKTAFLIGEHPATGNYETAIVGTNQ